MSNNTELGIVFLVLGPLSLVLGWLTSRGPHLVWKCVALFDVLVGVIAIAHGLELLI
jgi:hypothetical protein